MSTQTSQDNKLQIKFLLSLSTVYIAVNINIQGFLSLMPLVQADFAITRGQAVLYSSFLFLAATIMALLSGRVVDQIGSKRTLTYAPILTGAFILLHAVAPNYLILLILGESVKNPRYFNIEMNLQ